MQDSKDGYREDPADIESCSCRADCRGHAEIGGSKAILRQEPLEILTLEAAEALLGEWAAVALRKEAVEAILNTRLWRLLM